jgi:hypothetical protein
MNVQYILLGLGAGGLYVMIGSTQLDSLWAVDGLECCKTRAGNVPTADWPGGTSFNSQTTNIFR